MNNLIQKQFHFHNMTFGYKIIVSSLKYILLFACLCSALPLPQTEYEKGADVTSDITENHLAQESSSNHFYQHSSSQRTHVQDPSLNQRRFLSEQDPSFIKHLFPDVVVHNSALNSYSPTNPYKTISNVSDSSTTNNGQQSDATEIADDDDDFVKPPTAFHQDLFVDLEEFFNPVNTSTDHTPDFNTGTKADRNLDTGDQTGDNPDFDDDFWDRLNTHPHKNLFNTEGAINTGTESLSSITLSPREPILSGHVNNNGNNHNRVRTTPNSIRPLEHASLNPHLTNSDTNIHFLNADTSYISDSNSASIDHSRDTKLFTTASPSLSDLNIATENPYYSINNNQDSALNSGINNGLTTQSSSQVETAILEITQPFSYNNNNIQENFTEGENTQTADPRDLGTYTFEEEINKTRDTSIYIPSQKETQSTDRNLDLSVTTSENFAINITISPSTRAAISGNIDDNIDVTEEIFSNFSQEKAAKNSTEEPSSIDLSFFSNEGSGTWEEGDNNDVITSLQYPEYFETTTISYFKSHDNKNKQDSNQSNNEGINNNDNDDTLTTSDYLTKLNTVSPSGSGEEADNSKSNDVLGNRKKTDRDSRDTGIILGSTLTIAGVILLGIMITLCCACLRKNKGDKNTPGDNDNDNTSEESYGFSSTSLRRGNEKQQGELLSEEKVPNLDTYAIEPGANSSSDHQIQLPQPPQKSSVLGFSLGSLTWKRKDKKKKERYNLNGNNAEDDQLTVKDRIKAFEGQASPETENKSQEDSKPRKKKPKSKAFEEFESTGLIIGFGNHPRRNKSTDPDNQYATEFPGFPDQDGEHSNPQRDYGSRDQINEEEGLGSMGSMEYRMPCLSKSQESDRSISLSSGSKLTEDEGIHTMDSEDDELGSAVPRQTEILKSFRRAPPPRNRNRARRSFQKRAQTRDNTSLEGLEVREEDETEEQQNINGEDSTRDNICDKDNLKQSAVKFSINESDKRGYKTALSGGARRSIPLSDSTYNNGSKKSSHRLSFNNNSQNKSDEDKRKFLNRDSWLSEGYKPTPTERTVESDINPDKNWKSSSDISPVWKSRIGGIRNKTQSVHEKSTESSIEWKSTKENEKSSVPLNRQNAPSWINRNYDLSKERREKTPPINKPNNDNQTRRIHNTQSFNSSIDEKNTMKNNCDKVNDTPNNSNKISTTTWTPTPVLYTGKGQTPPRSFIHYKSSKDETNNNSSSTTSRSSASRPGSQHIENNNAVQSRLMSATSNDNTSKTSANYSAYEAEATFSDKGGNYSFYTPNPLEQDSDEDNKNEFEGSKNQNMKFQNDQSLYGHEQIHNFPTDSRSQANNNISSCDKSTREFASGANLKNDSIKDNSSTPLSGLGQSSEVTYKPSYHRGSAERMAFSTNKKQYYSKNVPNYENVAFSPTTPPTSNEPQHEHALFHSTPAYRTSSSYQLPQTPSPIYLSSMPGQYYPQSEVLKPGYGIARHDPSLLCSDNSVIQPKTSVIEKQTYETDDDVFYKENMRHDSGYYSRQQSYNTNLPSNNNQTYRQFSNRSEYPSPFPSNSARIPTSPVETSIHSNLSSPMDISNYTSLSSIQSPLSPLSAHGGDTENADFSNRNSMLSQTKRSVSQTFYKSDIAKPKRQLSTTDKSYNANVYRSQDSIDGKPQSHPHRSSTGSLLKFNSECEGTTV